MLLAMASSGLVLASSAKFSYQARTSVNIIIKTANEASEIIHNATGALKEINQDLIESNIGIEASGNLNSIANKFDSTADNIVNKATEDRQIINKAFKDCINHCDHKLKLDFGNNFISLSYILPCKKLLSAKPVLLEIGGGIYNLFNEVNSNIKNLTMIPNLVLICNPFTAPPEYLYQQENCPPHTIQIGDIPKVLKPYTCFDEDEEKCSYQEFLPSSEYEIIESYARSIQNLLNVYPCMEQLIGCELVKDALAQVVFKHCKPLKKFAKLTWLGVLFVAMFMMFLVVLWITIKAHHDDKHSSNDNGSDSSLQPHSVTENA
ncbi:hypothetical protein TSUD_89220 [Trifolium subterraneum]|uniref:Uncharacterized protein n=1 Tax=Trifolium subterraneum TaxID=3900 RepID=A0A2Z6PS12_TRISU|nr:hypothetical protein TSUD_89220 [Trifolium subterraneum]